MSTKLNKENKKTIKFSMKIVILSIVFIILYTVAQMILSYKVGMELAPTLTTCVYTFFGTEFSNKNKSKKRESFITKDSLFYFYIIT